MNFRKLTGRVLELAHKMATFVLGDPEPRRIILERAAIVHACAVHDDLVLVGDEQTLSAAPVWRDYLRFLKRQGCIVDGIDGLLP